MESTNLVNEGFIDEGFSQRRGCAFVTGASGGIGVAVAKLLAERGCDVVAVYRTNATVADEIVEFAHNLGRKAEAVSLDLTDADATVATVGEAAQAFGGIHTAVHAAGPFVPQEYLTRISPEQFHEQCVQDIGGFYNLLHAVGKHLREASAEDSEASAEKDGGSAEIDGHRNHGVGNLVAVTTCATRRYPKRDVLSSGPKGAVEALVRAFAREEGRFGVRANCVGPGMLTDGMASVLISSGEINEAAQAAARTNIALGTFGSAQDIAEAVCFLASTRARYITGQMLDIDGGYSI